MVRGLLIVLLSAGSAEYQTPKDQPKVVRGKTASEWIELLEKDPKPERRRAALVALSILGPKEPGVVVGVSTGLNDSDAAVRRQAAQTLGEMAPAAKVALDSLARTMESDKEPGVREAAAKALGRFGPDAKPVISSLTQALQDRHAGTRAAAAEGLSRSTIPCAASPYAQADQARDDFAVILMISRQPILCNNL